MMDTTTEHLIDEALQFLHGLPVTRRE